MEAKNLTHTETPVREGGKQDGKIADVSSKVIEFLRDGNHEAYIEVHRLYYESIYSFIFSMTKSEPDARDILQNTFIKLWENREKLDPEKGIKSFLYITARNNYVNFLKAKHSYENALNGVEAEEEDYCSSDDIVISKEIELLIKVAMNQMPPKRRKVFEMSYYQGLSNTAIAQKLGMTPSAVSSILSEARKDMEELRRVITSFLILFLLQ